MERYTPVKKETQNQYLEIWTHYSIGHLTQKQLAQFFECSEDKIANAIEWVANNRLKFDSKIVAEAAKEALKARLRDLNNNIIKIKENEPINWNAVIGMYKLVETTEKLLWQLQTVNQDNKDNIQTGNMLETCNRVNETISRMEPIHQKALSLVVGAEIFKKEMTIEEDGDMATIRVGIAREPEYVAQ